MATILVCDDIPATRRMARRFLEKAGHSVEEASNGDEAIGLIADKTIDLVLLDMVMPGKDGLDTIRDLAERGGNTPVIAMTGGDRETVDEALSLGAVSAVRKPLHSDVLLASVAAALEAAQTSTDG